LKQEYQKKNRILKVDEIIAARNSAIPAIDSRKRKANEVLITTGGKRNKSSDYVTHKELQRLKAVAFGGDTVSKDVVVAEQPTHDLWTYQPPSELQDPKYSFLEEKQPVREPASRRQAPMSLAASGKPFAAVKKPDAGKSYNPRFEDWEALVARAGEKEVDVELRRRRDAAAEAERMEKALAEAAKVEALEAAQGDEEYESAWESEWEGIQSEKEGDAAQGDETAEVLKKKRNKEKTKAERNRIQRRKEEERKAKWEAAMKKRDQQALRIRQIAKEVQAKELERSQSNLKAIDSSDESGDEEILRRRKFGKTPIPQAPLEVVLADELQESLRALRPEGNLLRDRFRNLLVNGKIEMRRPITQPKKARRDYTEKWSYKDWKLR